MNETLQSHRIRAALPIHGWIGLGLAGVFWWLNWGLIGLRSHWAFFPLWLGYCLAADGLVFYRRGTSLLTRNARKYAGLFLLSTLVWWLFEVFNVRLQNWIYLGSEQFTTLQFCAWATLSFTTVIPAVFGTSELAASFKSIQNLGKGPVIRMNHTTTLAFFTSGWIMLVLLLAWPHIFFPFVWISLFFITEPINIWLGFHNLGHEIEKGNWRPVITLWVGVLITAFFWEMWNYFSYPKWIYSIPWGDALHIFEMPLLGYGGYLPFALELYAFYNLVSGLIGKKEAQYIQIQ